MQNIKWDESLCVGFDEIDEDHQRIVNLFNLLCQAVSNQESPQYVDALFEELVSFTESHFRHEERLMVRHNYDGLDDHKDEHLDLIDLIRDLQRRFHEARHQLTADNIEYLKEWLTTHIVGQDMRLGYFLAQVI